MPKERLTPVLDYMTAPLDPYKGARTYSDDAGGVYVNPYYGMSKEQLLAKFHPGQTATQSFMNWAGSDPYRQGYGDPRENPFAPQLNNQGQVRTFDEDGKFGWDWAGLIAKFAAMIGSAGLASGAIGAGAAAGEGALAAGGSGLVDGLGAAAYEGIGTGALEAGGSGLVDGLGAADYGTAGGSEWFGNGGSLDGLEYGDFGYDGGPVTEGGGWMNQQYPDFPMAGEGGTSIYNPTTAGDYIKQMQMSGMSPTDMAKYLYNQMPSLPPGMQQVVKSFMSGDKSDGTMRTIGQLLATGLGIYGANRQASQIGTLSEQYAGYGAPYRAMLAQSYADPAGFLANSPDIKAAVGQGTDALARSLSTQGNPTGSGAALQQLQNYATQGLYGQLGNQRNQLANFGGLSNFNAAAPGLAGQAITSQGGALNALGSGISAITNPPTTLEQALNAINSNNFKPNNGTGLA